MSASSKVFVGGVVMSSWLGVAAATDVAVTVVSGESVTATESVIYAVPKKSGDVTPAPSAAVIDQVKKEFVPLVSVVRTGTRVSFPNSDNIRHQVYSFSPAKTFTLKLYSGRSSEPVIFDKPGVVTLGCNIHDQMIAWLLVVDTSWYALPDTSGSATLKNLPAGDYDLYVWHPSMAAPVGEPLRVDGSTTVTKTVRIDATSIVALRRRVALQDGAR